MLLLSALPFTGAHAHVNLLESRVLFVLFEDHSLNHVNLCFHVALALSNGQELGLVMGNCCEERGAHLLDELPRLGRKVKPEKVEVGQEAWMVVGQR